MRKFFTFSFFLLAVSMLIPIWMKADILNQTYTFQVYKFAQSYLEHEKNKIPNTKRIPAFPVLCTVSQSDGVCISGYAADFTSYEIWDAEGEMCLASFFDDTDFFDGLFSMTGEFQIRIMSDEYVLIGYISTDI